MSNVGTIALDDIPTSCECWYMTNEQMDPCRDDGLCSSCADALRCAACGEYEPEHEDDCDREFVAAAEREVA